MGAVSRRVRFGSSIPRSRSALPERGVSHLVTMEHPHSFFDPDTAPPLPSPGVDSTGSAALQLGRPSLRVAHILGHASAFVALGLHPSLAADIMHSCPRRAAELLMHQDCSLDHAGSRVLVLHRGLPLADPFPIPHASEESMAWELLTLSCIADAVRLGSGGLGSPGIAGAEAGFARAGALGPGMAASSARPVSPPLPFGASGAGKVVPAPGLVGSAPCAGVAPHVHLVAMVQQADSALLGDAERDRLALQLTASSAECAAVLTANRIMYGLIQDLPNLITCSGSILARGEQRVAGAALAWAQELVDLQRDVLPSRYSEPLFYDPPAPPGYLQATFLARDIPYPGVPLADIAGMCRAPAAGSGAAAGTLPSAAGTGASLGAVVLAGGAAKAAAGKGAVVPSPAVSALALGRVRRPGRSLLRRSSSRARWLLRWWSLVAGRGRRSLRWLRRWLLRWSLPRARGSLRRGLMAEGGVRWLLRWPSRRSLRRSSIRASGFLRWWSLVVGPERRFLLGSLRVFLRRSSPRAPRLLRWWSPRLRGGRWPVPRLGWRRRWRRGRLSRG